MPRTTHLNAVVLALFLISIPGSLVAQQSPTTPQAPSATPTTPDIECDDVTVGGSGAIECANG